MAASGDEGRTAVVEAGAIGPLVHLLGCGTALAKRWAAAALCAIAEPEIAPAFTSDDHTSDVRVTSDARVIVAHANALEPLGHPALRRPARPGAGGGGAGGGVGCDLDPNLAPSGRAPGAGFASSTRQRSRQGRCGDGGVLLAAEDNIVVKEAIIAANAIKPLAMMKDDGTPTLVSIDGKPSTNCEEASGALYARGWVAAVWALDRLDADDADEPARAVLSEVGEEKQAAARNWREAAADERAWFSGRLEAASSVWPPTRDGASLESLLEKRTVLGFLMRRRSAGTPGPSVGS